MERRVMLVLLTAVVVAVLQVEGSHFRGGTINWKWQKGKQVQFRFRLGWAYGTGPGCNPSHIGQHVDGAMDYWTCQSGNCGSNNIHDINYICTGASRSESWEQGKDDFTYNFTGTGPYTVGYSSGNWIALSNGKGNGEWNLSTLIDLRTRSDTGTPNSSPESLSKPMYYVQFGCENRIRLPVIDLDADTVRCRWARGAECSSVCDSLPFAVLDEETCTITFNTTHANMYIPNGIYAVAVTIEDFPRESIFLDGATRKSPSDALSSVPLQFLIKTVPHSSECGAGPRFVDPTPHERQVITTEEGEKISVDLYADNQGDKSAKANDITATGPINTTLSSVVPSMNHPNTYMTTLTWQPTSSDLGGHIVCAHVTNDRGSSGEQRCFIIKVVRKVEKASCPKQRTPCQNGGDWVANKRDYSCVCKPGFTGIHCEVDFKDCVELLKNHCPAS